MTPDTREVPADGGAAFPCTNEQFTHGNPQTGDAWSGMSLRDWFAGQALAGLLASPIDGPSWNMEDHAAHFARVSYAYADAMLAHRESQP